MAVQWFPGHMNKARKAIAERLKQIDIVIEVLDARLPASCVSPLLSKMAQGKTQLKVFNKVDLADPEKTRLWQEYFQKTQKCETVTMDARSKNARKIIEICRTLLPHRGGIDKPLRALICGVPNVGKSTLINALIQKKSAKTGNEPGITKAEQRLILADDFWLYDTPGMLWQKIIVPQSGDALAVAGSVGRNALDEETIALYLISVLKKHYPSALADRFRFAPLPSDAPDDEWFSAIAHRCGALLSGGRIDHQKCAERILQDFRSGALGLITLETPEEWVCWLKDAQRVEAERKRLLAQKQAEKKGFNGR